MVPKEVMEVVNSELKGVSEEAVVGYLGYNPLKEPDKIKLYEGKGCRECGEKGMKGRILISEIFDIDQNISQMIGDNASEYELLKVSQKEGFTNMKQDGILKVLKGETTIEEIQRVTDDDNEKEVIEVRE
jgi:type II secretory ATPase GspE/PulE/Tfp pilus assembly ATPase PilB-like protein